MNRALVGDIVMVKDGSKNFKIDQDGDFLHISNLGTMKDLRFEVMAINCILPSYNTIDPSKPGLTNNTIIRRNTSNEIFFTRGEFLTLAHRCTACPHCGEKF